MKEKFNLTTKSAHFINNQIINSSTIPKKDLFILKQNSNRSVDYMIAGKLVRVTPDIRERTPDIRDRAPDTSGLAPDIREKATDTRAKNG